VIAGILLAAGASSRMGRPKLALPVGSTTLLGAACAPFLASSLDRIVVVLGNDAGEIARRAALPPDPRLELVMNEAWAEGMASSLRRGVGACGDCEAVLLMPADLLGASVDLVDRVVAAARSGAPLVVPVHDGRASHPVAFGRALFGELAALRGDAGARAVVRRHLGRAVCLGGQRFHDIDREADYQGFLAGSPPRADEGLELALARITHEAVRDLPHE
jgi:molybdenum cofactor cytidylyltransferase